mmetsp:Transcript_3766/g.8486  ORF Transcript_3766/g.8486 Transcript_3766/m.8486 type:complete len:110 (+) Transcript_3766:80-409(+)
MYALLSLLGQAVSLSARFKHQEAEVHSPLVLFDPSALASATAETSPDLLSSEAVWNILPMWLKRFDGKQTARLCFFAFSAACSRVHRSPSVLHCTSVPDLWRATPDSGR